MVLYCFMKNKANIFIFFIFKLFEMQFCIHLFFFSFLVDDRYPTFKSILENLQGRYNSFNMSSNLGIEHLYFTITLLMTQQTIHASFKSHPFLVLTTLKLHMIHDFSFCHQLFHLSLKFPCLIELL